MKQKLLILLAALWSALGAYAFKVDGIYYNINGDNVEVTSSGNSPDEYSGDITIPSSVTYNDKTYAVTAIRRYAFSNCTDLTSISIPNSVTTIGDDAFRDCTGLTSINIPNSVITIGVGAFRHCTGLTSINIPNSVTTIGDGAFDSCTSLTNITLPNNIKNFGDNVFVDSKNLESISGDFASPDHRCWIVDGVLICFARAGLTSYNIPNSVTTIGDNAFNSCSNLTAIELPNSLISIGDNAFEFCTGLTSIKFPGTLTSIGSNAFSYCRGLTLIDFPDTLTSIGNGAFSGCEGLTSIDFSDSLTSIGDSVFSGCRGLTSIDFSDSLTSIGDYAFWGCDGLTSIKFPDSLTSIGESAFVICTSLTSIKFPNSLTSIGETAFWMCSGLTSIKLPDSLINIEGGTFDGCSGLTTIELPNALVSIGYGAFWGCKSLTSIKLPDSLTSIGEFAFYYCKDLTTIEIPKSVKSIGGGAFDGCTSLTSVTVCNDNPSNLSIGSNVFYDVPQSTCTLYVPVGSKELYEQAAPWKDFGNIVEINLNNKFELNTTEMPAERVTMLPVSMTNIDNIIGFQCDVELPEGFVLDKDDNGLYYVEKSARFRDHTVSASDIDGIVRFVVVSLNNSQFKDNEGVLFSLPVIANGEPRQVEITIRNIKVVTSDNFEEDVPSVTATISVLPAYILGDANGDGNITVGDVTATISAALGKTIPGFVTAAADIDGNGKISVGDVTGIISLVLKQSGRSKAPAMLSSREALSYDLEYTGAEVSATINLRDASDYIGAQIDMLIPEGCRVSGIGLLGANAETHQLAYSIVDGNVLRAIVVSMNNVPLSDDAVIMLKLDVASNAGELSFGECKGVDSTMTETALAGAGAVLSGISGIGSVSASAAGISVDGLTVSVESMTDMTVTVVDLCGRTTAVHVAKGVDSFTLPAPGFYVINGKKYYAN